MGFNGRRVFAFESRRAAEMAELIRRQGGVPFVAPSMREAPLADRSEAFAFAERLFGGGFDLVVFLTGVGTRALDKALAARYSEGRFAEALRRLTVAARGPKPLAVLRQMQVPVALIAPEPNTWRELVEVLRGRPERSVAVQEYGRSNPELIRALRDDGKQVTAVGVYRWDLPEDTALLREAARRIAAGEADVVAFTTAIQVAHLYRIAEQEGVRDAMDARLKSTTRIASIGPATSEMLAEFGLKPAMEPAHPKMGFLVKEAAEL